MVSESSSNRLPGESIIRETAGKLLHQHLQQAVARNASYLHLVSGKPPVLRIAGGFCVLDEPPLEAACIRSLLNEILSEQQNNWLEERKSVDFTIRSDEGRRFNLNVHFQRDSIAVAIRIVPYLIPAFDELLLPGKTIEALCQRPSGLVLVTGPSKSGKSTTLASMVSFISRQRECRIMTIERPIEFEHGHGRAIVTQREIPRDVSSFVTALESVSRQDIDVVMVSELPDLDVIRATLAAAEAGCLVLAAMHTGDVVQTIDRLIDIFPPHQQEALRVQLASVIEGVICQKLLPGSAGNVLSHEILLATDAVRNQIREKLTAQLYTTIQAGIKLGMISMDRSIVNLYQQGRITRETALGAAKKPEEVRQYI